MDPSPKQENSLEPPQNLYRQISQQKLSVIKKRRDKLNQGLASVGDLRAILDKFHDKKLSEFEELCIHIEELNYSYSNHRIGFEDYTTQYDNLRIQLELAAGQALDTTSSSRFIEEQLQEELFRNVPSSRWQDAQIAHGEALVVLQDIIRRNTFADEDTGSGKRNRPFRSDLITSYQLRVTLPATSPPPSEGWLPPRRFVSPDPHTPNTVSYLLDQVTGRWHDEELTSHSLTAAHLIPYKFTGKPLESLCGVTGDDINNFRNGLLMHKNLEKAFDKGIICFVPKCLDEPVQWKCVVVDSSKLNRSYETGHNFSEVHNKTLTFRTDARPSKTSCYFRFIVAWLRASEEQRNGVRTSHGLKGVRFVTPCPLVNQSVLSAMALHIGDNKDWEDLQEAENTNFYQGSVNNTLSRAQGVRLGSVLLVMTRRMRQLVEGGLISDDDSE